MYECTCVVTRAFKKQKKSPRTMQETSLRLLPLKSRP